MDKGDFNWTIDCLVVTVIVMIGIAMDNLTMPGAVAVYIIAGYLMFSARKFTYTVT